MQGRFEPLLVEGGPLKLRPPPIKHTTDTFTWLPRFQPQRLVNVRQDERDRKVVKNWTIKRGELRSLVHGESLPTHDRGPLSEPLTGVHVAPSGRRRGKPGLNVPHQEHKQAAAEARYVHEEPACTRPAAVSPRRSGFLTVCCRSSTHRKLEACFAMRP